MNEAIAIPPDVEALGKGKMYCGWLNGYLQLLEEEFNHPELPQHFQKMAQNGLEISTGKNFQLWFQFVQEMETRLEAWEKAPADLDRREYTSTLEQWRQLFEKLMSFINQVPLRAFELLRKKQTKEDVEKYFIQDGKPITAEILNWLNGLLGRPVSPAPEKSARMEASLGSRFHRAARESKWALEIKNVKKRYGDLEAVKGISASIEKGEIFGLLGPNGAGKTSLIECIEGIRQPDDGTVYVWGEEFSGQEKHIKEKIGVQLQNFGYYETVTVKEILKLYASFFQTSRDIDEVLQSLELEQKQNTIVKNLSGGQLQRLALGAALVNDPDVIFLDEPTSGLDPHARRNIWDIIRGLQSKGKTIILTTHYMEEAENLCSRVAIMNEGQFIALAPPDELIRKHTGEKTIEFYYEGNIREEDVKQLPAVNRTWTRNSKMIITSADHKQTLAGLLEWQRPGVTIEDIIIRRGNLEDVFLKLTDRGLDQ